MAQIIKLESISIKSSKDIDEKFIQDYIASDPSVLGIGDLILKDKERIQPNAGRLDLLLQDSETNRRYTVELQLGKTDASHIIRAIEYWDIERKRYPQYEHVAVIIAEDITTRFLNVIQLFNGNIPLIAIQMNAFKIEENIALKFIKILDEIKLEIEDDDDQAPTDRSYWENKGTKEVVLYADEILKIINEFEPNISIKYNKHYIGLAKSGIAFNFSIMRAKKKYLRLEFKLEKNEEMDKIIDDNGIDILEYDARYNRYQIIITKDLLKDKREIIKDILEKSYEYFNN